MTTGRALPICKNWATTNATDSYTVDSELPEIFMDITDYSRKEARLSEILIDYGREAKPANFGTNRDFSAKVPQRKTFVRKYKGISPDQNSSRVPLVEIRFDSSLVRIEPNRVAIRL